MNETTDAEIFNEQIDQVKLFEVNKAILDLEIKVHQLEIALNMNPKKEKTDDLP